MITASVGLGILAIAAVLWFWAFVMDRIGRRASAKRTYPPETQE